MRNLLRFTFVTLACAAAVASPAAAQSTKIGYVNTQAVLAQTPSRSAAEAEFNKQMAPYTAEAQLMDSTLKTMIASFTQDTTSAPAARQTRAAEIQQRQVQYEGRMAQIEDSAQTIRQRLMAPIMGQVERALDEVRREGNYAIIFDVASGSAIVAADTTLDVTPRVIAKMGGTAAPAATTGARPTGPVAAPAGVTSRPTSPPRR